MKVQSIEEIRQLLNEATKDEAMITWTCFNCNELVKGETHLCHYKEAWRQNRYTCVDCGHEGSLNSEITYRGNDYVCWPCIASSIHDDYRAMQAKSLERVAKALERLCQND